jgi:5-deoxy-5-amino-3-dehydroquinate synthase
VGDHDDVVKSYDLPTRLPLDVDVGALLAVMGRDKKATDGLTFVLDGPEGLAVVASVAPEEILATLHEMGTG